MAQMQQACPTLMLMHAKETLAKSFGMSAGDTLVIRFGVSFGASMEARFPRGNGGGPFSTRAASNFKTRVRALRAGQKPPEGSVRETKGVVGGGGGGGGAVARGLVKSA